MCSGWWALYGSLRWLLSLSLLYVCCRVLACVAVCCIVLQSSWAIGTELAVRALQCLAVCSGVLQCVAVFVGYCH